MPAALTGQTVWNEINYVLNNKGLTYNSQAATVADVQNAIWGLLGGSPGSLPVGLALYNAALANGATFSPAPGRRR